MPDPIAPPVPERGSDDMPQMTRRAVVSQFGLLGVMGPIGANTFALLAGSTSAPQVYAANSTIPTDITQDSNPMPLVKIDAYEGRTESEVKALLDAAHRAIVKAFHINERDRYQVFDARPRSHFLMQDTGLGIQRSDKALIITVFSKARPEILKRRLYKEMIDELQRSASIAPTDVMMAIFENGAADWTFGNGEAQFLTGDLG